MTRSRAASGSRSSPSPTVSPSSSCSHCIRRAGGRGEHVLHPDPQRQADSTTARRPGAVRQHLPHVPATEFRLSLLRSAAGRLIRQDSTRESQQDRHPPRSQRVDRPRIPQGTQRVRPVRHLRAGRARGIVTSPRPPRFPPRHVTRE